MSNQVNSTTVNADSRYNPSRMVNYLTWSAASTDAARTLPLIAVPPIQPYGFYFDTCNGVIQPDPDTLSAKQDYVGQIASTTADVVMFSIYDAVIGRRQTKFRIQTAGVYHFEGTIYMDAHNMPTTLSWGIGVVGDPMLYAMASVGCSSNNNDRTGCKIECLKYFKVGDVCSIVPIQGVAQVYYAAVGCLVPSQGTTYLSINKL